jgi:hypothetical protein
MDKKNWSIIGILLAVVVIGFGGMYWNMSHSVAKKVPGNTYRYQGASKSKALYVTFAKSGDQVIVNPDKKTAVDASKSTSAFDEAYKEQAKQASWNYKAKGGTLTLAEETTDGKISQWQYNGILATSKKLTAHSFIYQIAKAGQGEVKSKMVFEKVN